MTKPGRFDDMAMDLCNHFDFSNGHARPSVARIIAAWKKAGKPARFSVAYGETEAEFERHGARWYDSGNGCRGVDRLGVVKALEAASNPPSIRPYDDDKDFNPKSGRWE